MSVQLRNRRRESFRWRCCGTQSIGDRLRYRLDLVVSNLGVEHDELDAGGPAGLDSTLFHNSVSQQKGARITRVKSVDGISRLQVPFKKKLLVCSNYPSFPGLTYSSRYNPGANRLSH